MRTTLILEDSVFEKAKRKAAETGTTLSALTSLALNTFLMSQSKQAQRKPRFVMPVFGTKSGKEISLDEINKLRDEGR